MIFIKYVAILDNPHVTASHYLMVVLNCSSLLNPTPTLYSRQLSVTIDILMTPIPHFLILHQAKTPVVVVAW